QSDISTTSSTTTVAQLFASPKYNTVNSAGLYEVSTLATISPTLINYVSTQTTINADVISLAVQSGASTSTLYNILNTLKTYTSTNGISYGPSESPMIRVNVSAFILDKYEVSNADYKNFIDGDGYNKREYWTDAGWQWKTSNNITLPLYWNDSRYNQSTFPVVGVSWYEAYAYAKFSGKRLPTEAEWELAAKGNPSTDYPWNNKLFPWGNDDPSTLNNEDTLTVGADGSSVIRANGYFGADGSSIDNSKYMSDVNSFPKGASSSTSVNMSGNVSEWVNDWYQYEYYGRSNTEQTNPLGPATGTFKMTRGGSWSSNKNELRNTYRDQFLRPESRNLNLGFRCVSNQNPV
ncbi:MAG: formylglycine-generating enzyme family protein, partial [Candidatus Sericytochromatia bacterium]|nr:formylglycine-generating enzyme family protein [Candidatus Sericytochromatia bacterium]